MQNIGESTTSPKTMTKNFKSSNEFQNFLKQKLDEEHHALSLNDLSMDELVLLIIKGLAKPDLLVKYKDQVLDLIKQRNKRIDGYKKEINQWAFLTLENYDV